MALIVGNQKKTKALANVNKELLNLKGDLTD